MGENSNIAVAIFRIIYHNIQNETCLKEWSEGGDLALDLDGLISGFRAFQVVLVVITPTMQVRCKRHGFNPWVGKIP